MKRFTRLVALLSVLFVAFSTVPQAQAAGAKLGGACAKVGATATVSGKALVCAKVGTKLIWKNRIAVIKVNGVCAKAATKASVLGVIETPLLCTKVGTKLIWKIVKPKGSPIVIAITAATTGPLSPYGKDIIAVTTWFEKYVNSQGGVNGRPIKLKPYENDGTPADAVRVAQQVATQDGTHIMTGYSSSAQALAVQGVLKSLNLLFVDADSQADALTAAGCNAMYFRTAPSVSMNMNSLAGTVPKMGVTTWSRLSPDYAFGHDASDTFARLVTSQGGTVLPGLFPPLGSADYGSYITTLMGQKADGLFISVVGNDAVTFMKQAQSFGLLKKYKAILGYNTVDAMGFAAIGDAGVGLTGSVNYDAAGKSVQNQAFVVPFQQEFGRVPFYIEANTIVALELIFKGIKATNSVDGRTLSATLSGMQADTVAGHVTVRPEDHQVQRDNYIGIVQSNNRGLYWKITNVVPASVAATPVSPDCHL